MRDYLWNRHVLERFPVERQYPPQGKCTYCIPGTNDLIVVSFCFKSEHGELNVLRENGYSNYIFWLLLRSVKCFVFM